MQFKDFILIISIFICLGKQIYVIYTNIRLSFVNDKFV